MERIAVFPGSFDPITFGHIDIIRRGALMFDKVVVAIGNNTSKKYMLDFSDRLSLTEQIFAEDSRIDVLGYHELTVDLCKKLNARFLLRGLRSGLDYEYERSIAFMNQKLDEQIETVFLLTTPAYSGISSTIVREIAKFGGKLSAFVPGPVETFLKQKIF